MAAKPYRRTTVIGPFKRSVLRSTYGLELRRHRNELAPRGRTYRPVRGERGEMMQE